MRVPVIVSERVNIWPSVVESGAGIVLNESDIEIHLSDAVLSLLSAPEKIEQMGNAGVKYARKNLTWRRTGTCLLACYEDVLASSRLSSVNDDTKGFDGLDSHPHYDKKVIL
jgi:glycosyltransferase involved in cell wall biosynthesis